MTTARNDRRTLFGWAMYDFANSAYATTTVAVFLPVLVDEMIVPESGYRLFGTVVNGEQLGSLLIGFGAIIVFLLSPILGAIADFTNTKRRFLSISVVFGSVFGTLLYLVGEGDVTLTILLFLGAQTGFVSSIVFYDGFLPDITTPDTIDRISSRGFAYGYLGGGINLLMGTALVLLHERVGITEHHAARIAMASAGVWWLVVTLAVVLPRLEETGTAQPLPARYRDRNLLAALTAVGLRRTIDTTRRLREFPELLRFVVAFVLYNDGVATVLYIAPFYATGTLDLDAEALIGGVLLVQVVAAAGAIAFARYAGRVGTKRAILVSIGLWSVTLLVAFFVPARSIAMFLLVTALIGLVLGGTQALSRGLYGSMIPEEASAEFFGFYSVFEKFSAILGPFIFFAVNSITGSSRGAVLSLIVFFVAGGWLLWGLDVDEARASRLRWSFEGGTSVTGRWGDSVEETMTDGQ